MNRGRSSESLSSDGSSSPTDFTSDDEFSNEEFITGNSNLLTNKPDSSKTFSNLEHRISRLKSDIREPSTNYNNILHNRVNMYRQATSGRQSQSLIRPNDNNISGSSKYERNIDSFLDDISGSCNPSNSSLSNSLSSPSSTSHHVFAAPDNQSLYNDRSHLSIDNINTRRLLRRDIRGSHSGHLLNDENNENLVGSSIGVNENDDELDDADLFGRIDSTISNFTAPNRGINSITVRMCARLVECRNLIEAIEFVEQNRVLIDDLTQIITRDAPAFRNYNMSNYQIDYSIKESFNSDFWLDREPIVTTADGNCQYNAVSLSLTGCELYTPEVRLATAVAVIDNREWFDSMLKLIDRGTVLDLVHTIARSYSWGDETTLKAIAVAINRRIFLYTCNIGKKDYELVKSLSKDELIEAFREKKYRGGTGIHTYADPLVQVSANNYIMLFHKSEHFIAVLPTNQHPTMFEPYNPIVPVF